MVLNVGGKYGTGNALIVGQGEEKTGSPGSILKPVLADKPLDVPGLDMRLIGSALQCLHLAHNTAFT
jgi:hypothetical protein